ncbi:MAG: UPF0149 family protein [Gallionella sp.]
MYSTQPLNDDELDELDDLLMSQDMPENTMDISMLDGFFAALVLHPDLIMPSEYLRWIWDSEQGEDKPEFSSLAEANRILDLIMRHYNSVLQTITDDRFEPLFYVLPQEDGSEFFDAEGWSCGFILATSIFNEPWEPVFKERPELLTPMVLLGTERGWDMLERSGNNRLATQEAYEAIADAVSLIYEHFREQREASAQQRLARTDMKSNERPDMPDAGTGRDESCPCGSGRDFSECCGAARTLH